MSRSGFIGSCHCGNIEFVFETEKTPGQLDVRACDCSFCTKRGGRTTTDPHGSVRFTVRDGAKLNRYRFGLRTADFLICAECGVYIGVVISDDGRSYATLNVNTFGERDAFLDDAVSVNYDYETAAERMARRMAKWTSVTGFEEDVVGLEGLR
jgi:hypothetical protein